ncbi:MAG: hypothetical protein JSW05_00175 [Candidatus Thorarchaeota archaeon]|nr:MAG: hypothetical protein JSW05_00175 [Candidatus Thorarchaeota archaeon]
MARLGSSTQAPVLSLMALLHSCKIYAPEFEFYPDGWLETGLIHMYFPIERA